MQKNFKLETILTLVTGINFTDDFNEVFELVKFVYNDRFITSTGLSLLKDDIKYYLLSIHPKLNELGYLPYSNISKNIWLDTQKKKFGDFLPVYIMENDSEKDNILKKYNYKKRN